MYLNKFPYHTYIVILIKWKTGNQLKIRLVHVLVDEKTYSNHLYVKFLSKKMKKK